MLWVSLVLLFFSLSKSQLIPYIFPIFPVLAVLIARYLAAVCRNEQTPEFHRGVYAMAGHIPKSKSVASRSVEVKPSR